MRRCRADERRAAHRSLFRDERGFTTTSMVLSLLITLALVFSAAQVYRVNSASAEVQDVADAAALAAENQVAEFMIIARFCDATVLSLSLASITVSGLGIAALCIPPAAGMSEKLIEAGKSLMKTRDRFAQRAGSALNKLQEALPYFAAACAVGVAQANNADSSGANYLGIGLLVPAKGESITFEDNAKANELADEIDERADEVREKAKEAEQASRAADEAKQRAFMSDCGSYPERCMRERAESLAGMTGVQNPAYASVDAWSFQVALDRARSYYAERRYDDTPRDDTVEGQAKLQLMKRYCEYAYEVICSEGYVRETSTSFEARLPLPPKNTAEMKRTILYTEAVYPVTEQAGGVEDAGEGGNDDGGGESGGDGARRTMHAWEGCPGAHDKVVAYESISYLDANDLDPCPYCNFRVESMGSIASANTSIDSGFEHHYAIVSQEAERYQSERQKADEQKRAAQEEAGGLFDKLLDAFREAADKRIEPQPPGRFGSLAFVANVGSTSASGGFESMFAASTGSLGPRAAISASTLVEEGSDEGRTVINSLLDGLAGTGGVATGAAGIVLDAWSWSLSAYANGVDGVTSAIESGLNAIPLASASGLGTWAADKLREAVKGLGLQPAKLAALKPVLVNSAHVASKDEDGVGARLLAVKQRVVAHPLYSTDLFSALLSDAEREALAQIDDMGDSYEIASVELLGEGWPAIPVTIPIPPQVKEYGVGLLQEAFEWLRQMHVDTLEVKPWE